MPLRIFEERYKEMLDEVLNTTRMFGIVCERENVAEDEGAYGTSIWGCHRRINSSFQKAWTDGTSLFYFKVLGLLKYVELSRNALSHN